MNYQPSSPTLNPVVPQGFDMFGVWITETYNMWKAQWQVWTLQTLIFFAISIVPQTIMSIITDSPTADMAASANISQLMTGILLTSIPISIAIQLLTLWLTLGMYNTAMKQARGEEISVADMFSGGQFLLSGIGVSILSGLIGILGMLACFVGIFVVPGILFLAMPILVDQRCGSVFAITKSYETMKQNFWLFVVLGLVVPIIASVGIFACGIGMLATYSWMIIAEAVVYRSLFHSGGVTATTMYGGPVSFMTPPPPYTPYSRDMPAAEEMPNISSESMSVQTATRVEETTMQCSFCRAELAPGQERCQCGTPRTPAPDAQG